MIVGNYVVIWNKGTHQINYSDPYCYIILVGITHKE